jgi:hypothetical protein
MGFFVAVLCKVAFSALRTQVVEVEAQVRPHRAGNDVVDLDAWRAAVLAAGVEPDVPIAEPRPVVA